MYAQDSFFSLSTGGSIGLAVLSVVLSLGVLALAWRAMRGRGVLVRLAIAVALFAGFVWLSPQIYYTYYGFLFEDLPQQWVARFPTLTDLVQTVTFTGRATLSAHGKALLFWVLIVLAIARRGPHR